MKQYKKCARCKEKIEVKDKHQTPDIVCPICGTKLNNKIYS